MNTRQPRAYLKESGLLNSHFPCLPCHPRLQPLCGFLPTALMKYMIPRKTFVNHFQKYLLVEIVHAPYAGHLLICHHFSHREEAPAP